MGNVIKDSFEESLDKEANGQYLFLLAYEKERDSKIASFKEGAAWARGWFEEMYSDTGLHALDEKPPEGWRESAIYWEERQKVYWKIEEKLRAENQKLKEALEKSKEKLILYREAHSGEYVGGLEYTSLIELIDRALSGEDIS